MRQLLIGALTAFVVILAYDARVADAQAVAESNVEKREVHGQTVQSERDEQESLFNYYFKDRGLKYENKLSELKTTASVPSWLAKYHCRRTVDCLGMLGGAGFFIYTGWARNSEQSAKLNEIYDKAPNVKKWKDDLHPKKDEQPAKAKPAK